MAALALEVTAYLSVLNKSVIAGDGSWEWASFSERYSDVDYVVSLDRSH
jgi:hypothetical protein